MKNVSGIPGKEGQLFKAPPLKGLDDTVSQTANVKHATVTCFFQFHYALV